jgi:uncharacterized membrane protein YphA (DoxX/SURF4 family)
VSPTHPAHVRDAALLAVRLVLGSVLAAHGHRTPLPGIGTGTGTVGQGVEHAGVPVAVVLAAVVAVVELLAGLLVAAGLRTTAAACAGAVAAGAAALVHAPPDTRGGWELAATLAAALAALAAAGPGRWSGTHALRRRRARVPAPPRSPVAPPPTVHASGDEGIPPAGLPLIPLVRPIPGTPAFRDPAAVRSRTSRPVE